MEEPLYCASCSNALDDALIMVCDHNLCLNCARRALNESAQATDATKPAIRCWVCLQWTPLEPAAANILRQGPARPLPAAATPGPRGSASRPPTLAPSPGLGPAAVAAPAPAPVMMGQPLAQQFTVPQVACKVHPGEPVQFFCLAREVLLCAECLLGENKGPIDQVMSIKKAYPHVRAAIEQMLASYSERLDEIKAGEIAVEGRMRHLAAVAEQAKQHTAKVFAMVREALNEKERELLGRVAEVVKQRADSVDAEAASLKQRKHQLHANAELISTHMKLDDPVGTLAWYSESKQLLTQLGPGIGHSTPDLTIDHPSVAKLGDDIEQTCVKIRGLGGVLFQDERGGRFAPMATESGLTSPAATPTLSRPLDAREGGRGSGGPQMEGNLYTSPQIR